MGTKVAVIVSIIFFITGLVSGQDKSGKRQNSDFILIKKDKNINIYAKWIKVDNTRSARQLKAEFTVNASFEKVIFVIRDDKRATQWMSSTKTFYLLKKIDLNNWYSYVQYSIPWPFNNQDCIIKYEVLPSSNASQTEVRFNGVPNYLKEYKNVNRISHIEGTWILKNVGKDNTKVEYYVFSKQVPVFPRWLTDPIIQNNLKATMNAFREMVNN